MPRPKKTERTVDKHIYLPETTAAKVDALLFSEIEQRVPYGRFNELVARLLEEWVRSQEK